MACHSPASESSRPEREGLVVALAGNPNSGKTTIFNDLTGAHQHVGNYPGVTVEKKEGVCHHRGVRISVVDLPGTYSLTPYSVEEVVARDFLMDERPDVVVDVVDASNLERNLYLGVQLIQLGVPLVLAFNMSDVAERRGHAIDHGRLARLLGARIVPTIGHKGRGIPELLDALFDVADGRDLPARVEVYYGAEIEEELAKLVPLLDAEPDLAPRYPVRWLAVKLLEDDTQVRGRVEGAAKDPARLFEAAAASRHHLEQIFGDRPEIVIADRRYGFISGACQEAVTHTVEARHSTSDRIDAVVLHRLLGLPLFLLLTYLTFQFTFSLGEIPTGWLESLFGWLGDSVAALWPKSSESWVRALLVDGVIGGVGGVLTFVPYIMMLFFAIAVLEDTGYMARAAFIMDRVMHKIGLHGKSFIPMLIGFGCSVPAIMATRTLDTRRDRLTTMLIVPLMSCSARLVIYTVIIGAFFRNIVLFHVGPFPVGLQSVMLLAIYLTGVVVAVAAAKVLRVTILRGETTPFVMELPPYRVPTLRGLLIHMWERSWLYIKKAGTVILAFSIVLWALTTYPRKPKTRAAAEVQAIAQFEGFYAHRMAVLAEPLGVPGHGDALNLVWAAEGARRSAEAWCYPREARYAKLQKAHDDLMRRALDGPAGQRIAAFLKMGEAVTAVRGDHAEALETLGPEPDAAAALLLDHQRDDRLGKLEATDPGAYAAAVQYLDEIRATYDATREKRNNQRAAAELAHSVVGRIGRAIEPALRPLGFDWKIGTALIGAFGAKEVFVAQMSIVYAVGSDDNHTEALRERLRADYTPLVGFCIMLFCLVSMPCMATIAVTRRESGSWGWAMLQLGGLTALAYGLTLIVYQLGTLLGLGA